MAPLFANIGGDPNCPPIVLLHGFGGHHHIWDAVRAEIGTRARTIAYDLPGHAASLGLRDAVSARRAAAAILADLRDRTSDPVHLVGHSLGGAIATLMAISEPARVASLTLLSPGGFGDAINEAALRLFAAARTPEELDRALRPMCGPGYHPAATDLEVLAGIRNLAGQTELLAEMVAMIARDGRQGVIPAAAIETLAMPVTVVWGEEDDVLSPDHANGLPARFTLMRIPGAGHMLPNEQPEMAAKAVLRHLG